jgi:hypothetical protein
MENGGAPSKKKRAKSESESQDDHIVVMLVDTREPSEPVVTHACFNINNDRSHGLKFPKILDRMLNKSKDLQFSQVFTKSDIRSSKLDFVLMNCTDDGEEGFDLGYEDSEGEEMELGWVTDDIQKMIAMIGDKGHASARDMMMSNNSTFLLDVKWVRIDLTQ